MSDLPVVKERLLSIYQTLAQYPILASRVRQEMRNELFLRGIVNPRLFENDVRELAIASQHREGLVNPYEEEWHIWETRLANVRDYLTDLIFSEHFPYEQFERILDQVLNERGAQAQEMLLSLNPELVPVDLVLEQAMTIERMPPQERAQYEPRLQEAKVVLIRTLISDQLRYINIAKEYFTVSDLAEILRRKIGGGRIGGKAAGMLLALRIIQKEAQGLLDACIAPTESYYIASDEFYTYMEINNLVHWNDQKYKSEAQMRQEYPEIVRDFENGEFPRDIVERFREILEIVGKKPLIVRSSSLLEDNFGTAFAGKYESIFLPNQGTPQQNLTDLQKAIARVFASTLNPNALLYRRHHGLQDYDERMAVLLQVVQGEQFKHYYLPHAAGVAFSRNLFRWTPQIRREDGFVRLVWGLGTRAVDRVGNDYPRLIALSHPTLRPSTNPKAIRRYSQQFVDVIDLQDNRFKTLPVHDVLNARYPPLRYLAQLDEDGYFVSLRSSVMDGDPSKLVLTFEELLRRTPFAEQMRNILQTLERCYRTPVDVEFTLHLNNLQSGQPSICINILQCRPQSHLLDTEQEPLPTDLRQDDIVFITHFVVPQGYVRRVDYVVFISPEAYFSLPTLNDRYELARAIGHLNAVLSDKLFICVGPGRWGSSNTDLGVPIDYGDIYNAKALVELAGKGIGPEPEPSLGTHFFQDLLEAQIYPLAVYLDDSATVFNYKFFYRTPSHTREFIEVDEKLAECLRVIRVSDYRPESYLRIVMNDEMGQATAFLVGEMESEEETARTRHALLRAAPETNREIFS